MSDEFIFEERQMETFDNMDLRAAAEYYKDMYDNSNASHAETVATMQTLQTELAAALERAEKAEANIAEMNKVIELLQSQRDKLRDELKADRNLLQAEIARLERKLNPPEPPYGDGSP